MKVATEAGTLGQALALRSKKTQALAHLLAADGALSIATSDGNITVRSVIAANIFEPGETSVSADLLDRLINAFSGDAAVIMTASKNAVMITSGGGRYRLPTADAPALLALTGKTTEVSLSTTDLLTLFEPLPAAESETTRFYLCGIYLHKLAGQLFAVATNGVSLLQTSVAADDASSFPGSIVPTAAATTLARIIRQTKPDRVTLRRGGNLLEVITPILSCVTRLIDATYPDYQRIIPQPSANVATCSRSDLSAALDRLATAATALPLVALTWRAGKLLHLFLARQPDAGSDIIAAETQGKAQIALKLSAFAELIAEFDGENICLEAADDHALVIRAGSKLGLLTSCNWNFREVEALVA